MIIDFHTHLFPKSIRMNRQDYFAGEPAFTLLYQSPKSRLAGAEELVGVMDEQGIDVAVVFGFPWRNAKVYQIHNDYILDVVTRFPKRLVGFACFDIASESAESEARRCIEAGLSGIGELAFYESGIDKKCLDLLLPVMELCQDKDLPVLIHTNEPVGHHYPGKTPIRIEQIYEMVKRFSENKLVLAHWGGGIFFYNLLKKEAKDVLKNVYFDTAASPFLYDPEIYSVACKLTGREKILLGSDFPLLKPRRYFSELDAAGVAGADRAAICGANAKKLLKL
jgi:predicted TIM-barrel fold metal-dependent hydrolase